MKTIEDVLIDLSKEFRLKLEELTGILLDSYVANISPNCITISVLSESSDSDSTIRTAFGTDIKLYANKKSILNPGGAISMNYSANGSHTYEHTAILQKNVLIGKLSDILIHNPNDLDRLVKSYCIKHETIITNHYKDLKS